VVVHSAQELETTEFEAFLNHAAGGYLNLLNLLGFEDDPPPDEPAPSKATRERPRRKKPEPA
jgi:hypothetical protein